MIKVNAAAKEAVTLIMIIRRILAIVTLVIIWQQMAAASAMKQSLIVTFALPKILRKHMLNWLMSIWTLQESIYNVIPAHTPPINHL